MCAFYLAFCTSKKQAVRPDGTGHSLPPAAHISKKVRCCAAAQKEPQRGADSPASWQAQPGRALCSGVLRYSPGRVGVVYLGKKQVGAGCDMRVLSTQPKAGTLPGVP